MILPQDGCKCADSCTKELVVQQFVSRSPVIISIGRCMAVRDLRRGGRSRSLNAGLTVRGAPCKDSAV